LLAELLLIGLGDGLETIDVVGPAGQDDLDGLARLVDEDPVLRVAPGARGIENGKPIGKRGLISRSTKRANCAALTPSRSPILRPNRSCATCRGSCEA